MPGSTLDIHPGAPQNISGTNFATGSTVYNNDETNSIWISSSQSVSPGNGIQVPPLGSIEWSAENNRPAWACVDQGVQSNVSITISNDINNLQDPLGIAQAIANKGIPAVLLDEQIFTGALPAGTGTTTIDVSRYASVSISTNSENYDIRFCTDVAGTNVIYQGTFRGDLSINVIAPFMILRNDIGAIRSYIVYGSNRNLTTRYQVSNNDQLIYACNDQATPAIAGQEYLLSLTPQLPQVNGINLPPGQALGYFNIGGTVVTGYFFSMDVVTNKQILADSSEMGTLSLGGRFVIKMVALPANAQIWFHCVVGGTGNRNVQLTTCQIA